MRLRYICLITLLGAGCRVGEPAPTTPTAPSRAEPMVRIGIKVDTAAVVLATTTPAQLLGQDDRVITEIPANELWTFTAAGSTIVATSPRGQSFTTSATPAKLQPGANGFVRAGRCV